MNRCRRFAYTTFMVKTEDSHRFKREDNGLAEDGPP